MFWIWAYLIFSYILMVVAGILYIIDEKTQVEGEEINEIIFYIVTAPVSFPVALGLSITYLFRKNNSKKTQGGVNSN